MSASLAILTIGVVPMCEVLPLLTEYIDEQHITHHSLLGQMRREDVMAEYGVSPGDEPLLTLLSDHQLAHVSRQKVERSLQSIVEVLDNRGFDVILLMSTASIARLTARNSILLEPLRIIPAGGLDCRWASGRGYCPRHRIAQSPDAKMAGVTNSTSVCRGESDRRYRTTID